jgi:hypothetical protein
MGAPVTASRRRWIAGGVAAGILAGAVAGAGLFTNAVPDPPSGPRPVVLHAAPALVRAGRPVDLTVTSVCAKPNDPACQVVDATAVVTPAGVGGSATVPGRTGSGVIRFRIPAALVEPDGFSYRFELATASGATVAYPPGAANGAIRVVTTAGLPQRSLAPFSWDRIAAPAETVLRLPVGSTDGRIGIAGEGTEGGASGPSSFDVDDDGSIVVADWVNGRTQRFSARGSYVAQAPLPPGRPLDIALSTSGLVATTLGVDAEAFELSTSGRIVGRYEVGYGVASRIVAGAVPRVRVGSGQWIPVRSVPGAGLTAEDQARAQTATVPLADGSVGIAEVVDDRLAVAWTRPDGSRAGVVLRLPDGVLPGADYVVRPRDDGGALVVRGLWDATHFGVAVISLDAGGRVRGFALLPQPTTRMAAPFSTVRAGGDGAVFIARDAGDGMRIDRFEVR